MVWEMLAVRRTFRGTTWSSVQKSVNSSTTGGTAPQQGVDAPVQGTTMVTVRPPCATRCAGKCCTTYWH
eukprot:11184653-Lingulodinium_polyedra.AAC.1